MLTWKAVFIAFFLSFATVKACEPKPFYGITYAPLALNPYTMCLDPEQVVKDMDVIGKLAHSVRIYSISNCAVNTHIIMQKAREHGMSVLLGMWMESVVDEVFEAELKFLPEVMKYYGDLIDSVIVGNEPVFIEEIDVDKVIRAVNDTRVVLRDLGYTHRISVAEVWPMLETEDGKKLVDSVDFVCMNMQPYWEGFFSRCPEDDKTCVSAGDYINRKAAGLEEYFQKEVRLCESGWPTDGEPCCTGNRDNAQSGLHAVPSMNNSVYFVKDFVEHARARGRKFYVHTTFDEEWKQIYDPCNECKGTQVSRLGGEEECGSCVVDYKWGMYTYDREKKLGYDLPYPENQCGFY